MMDEEKKVINEDDVFNILKYVDRDEANAVCVYLTTELVFCRHGRLTVNEIQDLYYDGKPRCDGNGVAMKVFALQMSAGDRNYSIAVERAQLCARDFIAGYRLALSQHVDPAPARKRGVKSKAKS